MRKIDEKKQLAIKQAAIQLVCTAGLTNLTTAKVTKTAGVSPATLYIYYQDKTDMLSRLYEEVKDQLHAGSGEVLAAAPTLDDKIRALLRFSVRQFQRFPQETQFVNVLWSNPEVLDAQAVKHGSMTDGILKQLMEAIEAASEFAPTTATELEILFSVPGQVASRAGDLTDMQLDQLIEKILRAVRA
ncbi:transcriptional regulator [Lactiplantibacillus fabifermentans T30PCM01]|uniref:Transcriptional regulator n=1 Tax=Lactiplantibacillus fabifermentans T30PCM01 TaxID=1400520 RepID=W6TBF4_9LACO|nr:TetR/AcrR family transcriptional regulator [Lactiplantibacillus fabifermentans]ETY72545.1 transcriptional regulator [Lactiplantibacillus fabifermentans T30PCM01]